MYAEKPKRRSYRSAFWAFLRFWLGRFCRVKNMDNADLYMFWAAFGLEKMNSLEQFIFTGTFERLTMDNSQISILSPSTGVVLKSIYMKS
jgi:hypothetical protein